MVEIKEGNTTAIKLSPKAHAALKNIEPLHAYESITKNGFKYTLCGAFVLRNISADKLNSFLERAADELIRRAN